MRSFKKIGGIVLILLGIKIIFSFELAGNIEEKHILPELKIFSSELYQGDVFVGQVLGDLDKSQVYVNDKELNIIPISEGKGVIFKGIDTRANYKELNIDFVFAGKLLQEERVLVGSKSWPVTEFVLSDKQKDQGYTPSVAKEEIIGNDNVSIYDVLETPLGEVYFNGSFVYPLEGERGVVGGFGNVRKSGGVEIRHLGVDLDGKKGDMVFATQKGKVRLARYLSNFGNTVVIDHGGSIFSLYLHLDGLNTANGDLVERGQFIGSVGNTGDYSLEPHLHFSIKVGEISVDPLKFLKASEVLD